MANVSKTGGSYTAYEPHAEYVADKDADCVSSLTDAVPIILLFTALYAGYLQLRTSNTHVSSL